MQTRRGAGEASDAADGASAAETAPAAAEDATSTYVASFAEAQGVRAVVELLRQRPDDAAWLNAGLTALVSVLDPTGPGIGASGTEAADAGALEACFAALRDHAGRLDTVTCVCDALAALLLAPVLDRVDSSAIFALVAAMRTFPDAVDMQVPACLSLSCLASDDALREEVRRAGVLDVVASVWKANAGTSRLVIVASRVVERFVNERERWQARAVQLGLHELIVAQLTLLVMKRSHHGEENALLAIGVFEALVALVGTPEGCGVNRAACKVLVAAGALELVIAVMAAFAANCKVQTAGSIALSALTTNVAAAARAAEAGALTLVLNAMRAHPFHLTLLGNAGIVIKNICRESSSEAAKAVAAGATELLVTALRAHPADSEVQTLPRSNFCREGPPGSYAGTSPPIAAT